MRSLLTVAVILSLLASPFLAAEEPKPDEALREALSHRDAGNYDRAMEALKDLLETRPADSAILLELARTAWYQAQEILSSEGPSLGGLALIDAMNWCRKAVEASPGDIEALRLLGATAASASDFTAGADAYRRAAALAPEDGELHYGLGYCLAWNRQFEEALVAFQAAGKLLGDDPRVLLNRAVCHESLGDTVSARTWFTKLIDVELDAGRTNSEQVRSAWVWLWRIHRQTGDYPMAARVFGELGERHPTSSAAWYYQGFAFRETGDRRRAAAAFAKVVEISPAYAEGWRLLGEEQVAAGDLAGVRATYARLMELTPGAEAPRDLLIAIARAMEKRNKRTEALGLVVAEADAFDDDPAIADITGDLFFRLGNLEKALAAYRRCAELDPFSDAHPIKAEKVVTALVRGGSGSHLRVPSEEAPPVSGGRIFDFEQPGVFFRVQGGRGARKDDSFALSRLYVPKPPSPVAQLTLIPTLDTTPYKILRFGAKGPEGLKLRLRAKDCYDEFDMRDVNIRLAIPDPLVLTGDWKTFEVPLDSFVSKSDRRPIVMNRSRLRMLIFDLGGVPESEVLFDDIYLVAEDETEYLLEDFDMEPAETTFIPEGGAAAFARTLFTPDQIPGFHPDPNTFVTPAIFGKEYDPAMVHAGEGAFRLTLRQAGQPASGILTFNPDRSYDDATAITFWARGTSGGEKLRVTLRDAIDDDMGNQSPASAPRTVLNGNVEEGVYILSDKWQKFRIERRFFPDVNFDALAEIRFHMGGPEGNKVGATIYLDDIGWE